MKTRVKLLCSCTALALLLGCSSKMEREFKAGCTSGGVPKSVCSCVYDKMEPQLQRAEQNLAIMATKAFQESYVAAVVSCSR